MTDLETRLRRDLATLADAVDDEGEVEIRADSGRQTRQRTVFVAAAAAMTMGLAGAGVWGASRDRPSVDVPRATADTSVPGSTDPDGGVAHDRMLASGSVSVRIFSGRPNPTFALSAGTADAVSDVLASLMPSTESPPVPGLGFSGFDVVGVDADGAEVLIDVRSGFVAITGPDSVVLGDPRDQVMALLAEQAVNEEPDLRAELAPWL